jgi:hypothetical protein
MDCSCDAAIRCLIQCEAGSHLRYSMLVTLGKATFLRRTEQAFLFAHTFRVLRRSLAVVLTRYRPLKVASWGSANWH